MKKFTKIILILVAIALVAAALFIYYLQVKKPDSTKIASVQTNENVLIDAVSSQTPTFKNASISGSVLLSTQPAKGSVEISAINYPLQEGKFTIATLSPGIYPISYLNESGVQQKLTPPSIQVFPGENSSFEFNVNP